MGKSAPGSVKITTATKVTKVMRFVGTNIRDVSNPCETDEDQ